MVVQRTAKWHQCMQQHVVVHMWKGPEPAGLEPVGVQICLSAIAAVTSIALFILVIANYLFE